MSQLQLISVLLYVLVLLALSRIANTEFQNAESTGWKVVLAIVELITILTALFFVILATPHVWRNL